MRTKESYLYWLGKHHSDETKKKISDKAKGRPSAMKGKHHSEASKLLMSLKRGDKPTTLGQKHSEQTKEKIRQKALGRKLSEEHKAKIAKSQIGLKKTFSEEAKRKLVERMSGPNSPSWKGGISKERVRVFSPEDIQWRKNIFRRDNYTCIKCGNHGGVLNAHHLKSWNDFPELRTNINNGITLCQVCHRQVHKEGENVISILVDDRIIQPLQL